MKYVLLIAAIITIAFTSALSIPGSPFLINGMTQATISDKFPAAITPAGVTFSIWSLIYLSWVVVGIFLTGVSLPSFITKMLPKSWRATQYKKTPKNVILAFSAVMLLSGVWLIPWWYLWIGTALVVMLIILWLLKYLFRHSRDLHPVVKSSIELTVGWINIATVANVTIWLMSIGFQWAGYPEVYWAIWVLWVALLITAYYQCKYRAYIVSLVFLWTLLWVWIAHPDYNQRWAVVIFAIAISINMLITLLRRKK